MPFGKKRTGAKATTFSKRINRPRLRTKSKYFKTPSPSEGQSPPSIPGARPELKGFLKHKEWVLGYPLSTKVDRVRQQLNEGTYRRPRRRNADLRDRKVAYGAQIGSVPGDRFKAAHFIGSTHPAEKRKQARANLKALAEHKAERRTQPARTKIEVDLSGPTKKKDRRPIDRRNYKSEKRAEKDAKMSASQTRLMRESEGEGIRVVMEGWQDRFDESINRAVWEGRTENQGKDWAKYREMPTEVDLENSSTSYRHRNLGREPEVIGKDKNGRDVYGRLGLKFHSHS